MFLDENKKEGIVQITKNSNNKYSLRPLPILTSIKYGGDNTVKATRECNDIHEKDEDKKSVMVGGSQSTFLSNGGFTPICATIDTDLAHLANPEIKYIARDPNVEQDCGENFFITGFAARDDKDGWKSRKYWVGRYICQSFTND